MTTFNVDLQEVKPTNLQELALTALLSEENLRESMKLMVGSEQRRRLAAEFFAYYDTFASGIGINPKMSEEQAERILITPYKKASDSIG